MKVPFVECAIEDFVSVLNCKKTQDETIYRLTSHFNDIRRKRMANIKKYHRQREKYANERESIIEKFNQLNNERKDGQILLEEIQLQQKIINKKLQNTMKLQEKSRNTVEEEKKRKEHLALEMVDVLQKQEDAKTAKVKEWNAIKKAMALYKDRLNIYISLNVMEDHDMITFVFFFDCNPNKDNYYVRLLNFNDLKWRVVEVKPTLRDRHLKTLKLDFSKDYEKQEIRKFFCQIRKIFLSDDFKN